MREKTTEEERKWRQSLEDKENLLEEAGKWLLDLRHLLVASIDEEDVVSGVQSMEAEFSGRLHESFFPVEEGHFVVTFPEWCQLSLNQLQEEIMEFTVKAWHPKELELEREFCLQDSKLRRILSMAVSDEDGHLFVVDGGDKSINEFGETGEFVEQCPVQDEGFFPWDICCLSQDNFVVCGEGLSPPPASKFHPFFPPSPLNCLSLFLFFNLPPPPLTFSLSLYLLLVVQSAIHSSSATSSIASSTAIPVETSNVSAAASTLSAAASTLSAARFNIYAATSILSAAASTLSAARPNLSAATSILSAATSTLSATTSTLSAATSTLSAARPNLSAATSILSAATSTLSATTSTLSAATSTLSAARPNLSAATSILSATTSTLSATTSTLYTATQSPSKSSDQCCETSAIPLSCEKR
ncbi:unnamed protein product [Acanthosepion pharaonis]|uniref:Uncharacterized protein n=1 Tax=Acanthosepion pharaonis TaxID=158019 RepID=A0A812CAV3_ACAPH|nr:unnamed protein product [Sepia pharaonis]